MFSNPDEIPKTPRIKYNEQKDEKVSIKMESSGISTLINMDCNENDPKEASGLDICCCRDTLCCLLTCGLRACIHEVTIDSYKKEQKALNEFIEYFKDRHLNIDDQNDEKILYDKYCNLLLTKVKDSCKYLTIVIKAIGETKKLSEENMKKIYEEIYKSHDIRELVEENIKKIYTLKKCTEDDIKQIGIIKYQSIDDDIKQIKETKCQNDNAREEIQKYLETKRQRIINDICKICSILERHDISSKYLKKYLETCMSMTDYDIVVKISGEQSLTSEPKKSIYEKILGLNPECITSGGWGVYFKVSDANIPPICKIHTYNCAKVNHSGNECKCQQIDPDDSNLYMFCILANGNETAIRLLTPEEKLKQVDLNPVQQELYAFFKNRIYEHITKIDLDIFIKRLHTQKIQFLYNEWKRIFPVNLPIDESINEKITLKRKLSKCCMLSIIAIAFIASIIGTIIGIVYRITD